MYVTFFGIVFCSSLALFRDSRPYSVNRMFWLFFMVFFGLAPTIQVVGHMLAWGNDLSYATMLRTNLLVLASMGAYQLTRYVAVSLTEGQLPLVRERVTGGFVRAHRTWGFWLFLLICIAYFAIAGLNNIFLQKYILLKWRDRVPDAVYLLGEKALRGPVLYYLLITIFLFRLRKVRKGMLALVLGLALLVNFPLAMPRTLAAAVVVGIVLSFGGRVWQRNRQAFTLILLAGLLLIFPLMQAARWTSAHQELSFRQPQRIYEHAFATGDFDAYTSLARTLDYVAANGRMNGRQLLTSVSFLVPRKFWPGKSIGTGALVHRNAGYKFTNVSSPLLAEGFIDFGAIGALLYAALFAILAYWYDSLYWRWRTHRAAEGDVSFSVLFYPVMLVLLFVLLRGDLLSSLALIAGFYAAGYFFHGLLRLPIGPPASK